MSALRTLALAGLVVCVAAPLALAQGLGDAASREKKKREAAPAAERKAYTDDDLRALPRAVAEDAPEAAETTSGSGSEGPAFKPTVPLPRPPSSPGRASQAGDEQRWRSRVAQARARVEQARQAYEKVSSMYLVPGYEYADAHGRTVVRSAEELQQLTAAARDRVDAAEKALDGLLEEARRAGVPPGWLR